MDGTFELFRAYYGFPPARAPNGTEVGATRGLMRSLLALLSAKEVSHVAVAFDHVIESFRNELFPGYKTSEGVPPDLLAQFPLAERAADALGIVVWPMVEFEADDALAAGAARWASEGAVDQIVVCSPDKDLLQCVRGTRVVCLDRMRRRLYDEEAVLEKFGVGPASIPDWLALVGDSADGIPGIPRWGARSAGLLLRRYVHLEAIPDDERKWDVGVRGAPGLAESLRDRRQEAIFYRCLATLRTDVELAEDLEDLRWRGVRGGMLGALCEEIGDSEIQSRLAGLLQRPSP